MRNKIDLIEVELKTQNIDIACITEHWFQINQLDLLHINDYRLVSIFCRSSFSGGGVAVLCRSSLNMHITELSGLGIESVEKDIEIAGIEIKINGFIVIIVAFYRSPNGNVNTFFTVFEAVLKKILSNRCCLFYAVTGILIIYQTVL